MAENSKIEWTHHTFNPWTLSGRNPKALGVWGPKGTRVIAAESYWQQPIKWNALATARGERHRVFCASLADIFEGPETMPKECWKPVSLARERTLKIIEATPSLDWLLLTKRPENVTLWGPTMMEWCQNKFPPNVWIGTSCEDQANADERIPHLLKCPAAVRFLSCEPLIGPIDLNAIRHGHYPDDPEATIHAFHGCDGEGGIDWVIIGGESGGQARPMSLAWASRIVDDCRGSGVPVFVKQLGKVPMGCDPDGEAPWPVSDSHGKNINEFPEELRIREFPEGTL